MRLTTGRNFDAGALCPRCEAHIGEEKFCRCGAPTINASFAERTQYELEQYRAYKAQQSA
jgi:hypothetical protein